jgi:hypothetical protein
MKIIITEKQTNLLIEGLPTKLRRRLNYESLRDELDYNLLYELNPCDWDDEGDFIGDTCDTFSRKIIDDEEIEVLPKESDSLYYFLLDTFGEYLSKVYQNKCD